MEFAIGISEQDLMYSTNKTWSCRRSLLPFDPAPTPSLRHPNYERVQTIQFMAAGCSAFVGSD